MRRPYTDADPRRCLRPWRVTVAGYPKPASRDEGYFRAPNGEHLWAEMRGNLSGILGMTDEALSVNNDGAGRGILRFPPWPRASRTIT